MMAAAEAMEFERAARLRDRIAALSAIQGAQGINPKTVEEADVFAIVEEAGQFAVEVFFFRTYQNWGNRTYYPRADRSLGPARCSTASWRSSISTSRRRAWCCCRTRSRTGRVLRGAVASAAGTRVEIAVPQRGEKRDLVDHAAQNGREALAASWPTRRARRSCWRRSRHAFGIDRTIAPRRGLRQFPHHGHQCGRRHDRGGAVGLPEDPLPHLQHEGRHARRRFRHDARDAAPALRRLLREDAAPADERRGALDDDMPRRGSAGRRRPAARGAGRHSPTTAAADRAKPSRSTSTRLALAGPDPDRRRQGPARGRARRCWPNSACRCCSAPAAVPRVASSASPRGRTATPAVRRSSWRAASRSSWRRAILPSTSSSGCATRRIASPSARTGPPQEGDHPQPARRDRRHRPGPQARAAARLRHRQGHRARRARRPREGARRQRRDRPARLRLFSRAGGV